MKLNKHKDAFSTTQINVFLSFRHKVDVNFQTQDFLSLPLGQQQS